MIPAQGSLWDFPAASCLCVTHALPTPGYSMIWVQSKWLMNSLTCSAKYKLIDQITSTCFVPKDSMVYTASTRTHVFNFIWTVSADTCIYVEDFWSPDIYKVAVSTGVLFYGSISCNFLTMQKLVHNVGVIEGIQHYCHNHEGNAQMDRIISPCTTAFASQQQETWEQRGKSPSRSENTTPSQLGHSSKQGG